MFNTQVVEPEGTCIFPGKSRLQMDVRCGRGWGISWWHMLSGWQVKNKTRYVCVYIPSCTTLVMFLSTSVGTRLWFFVYHQIMTLFLLICCSIAQLLQHCVVACPAASNSVMSCLCGNPTCCLSVKCCWWLPNGINTWQVTGQEKQTQQQIDSGALKGTFLVDSSWRYGQVLRSLGWNSWHKIWVAESDRLLWDDFEGYTFLTQTPAL